MPPHTSVLLHVLSSFTLFFRVFLLRKKNVTKDKEEEEEDKERLERKTMQRTEGKSGKKYGFATMRAHKISSHFLVEEDSNKDKKKKKGRELFSLSLHKDTSLRLSGLLLTPANRQCNKVIDSFIAAVKWSVRSVS